MCSFLTENIGECTHVNRINFPLPVKDLEIWQYAKDNRYIIITQDADFLNFLETKSYPPKVVLLKTGNINRKQMEAILLQSREAIIELHNSTEYGLLEII